MGRAGKSTGKNKSWFNIQPISGGEAESINLEVIKWKHEDLNVENVNIVLVSKSEQNTQECLRAKLEEIEKQKKYETYKEVDDVGQFRIENHLGALVQKWRCTSPISS